MYLSDFMLEIGQRSNMSTTCTIVSTLTQVERPKHAQLRAISKTEGALTNIGILDIPGQKLLVWLVAKEGQKLFRTSWWSPVLFLKSLPAYSESLDDPQLLSASHDCGGEVAARYSLGVNTGCSFLRAYVLLFCTKLQSTIHATWVTLPINANYIYIRTIIINYTYMCSYHLISLRWLGGRSIKSIC